MNTEVNKKSGFVLRFLSLPPLTCGFLFLGIVIVSNSELQKIIPESPFRSLSIMFFYIVAIMSFNYMLALRGQNFMGWKVEGAIVTFFAFIFASFFLPYCFPLNVEVEAGGLIGWIGATDVQQKPNWAFLWFLLPSIIFIIYAYLKLRKMDLWNNPG